MSKFAFMQPLRNRIADYFVHQPVLRAYLFGSFARNENDKQSDIDILLELDETVPIGLEYVKMYLDLKEITGREVDLVTEKMLSVYVRPAVEKEKVLIYERKAGR